MRYMIRKLTLLAASLMILAVPALAEQGRLDRMQDEGVRADKNECLLVSANCVNQVDTIQQRIDRIKGEISRGSDVYTNDELRRLNLKLNDAVKTMEELSAGG